MKTAALSLFCASLAAWLAACSAEQSMPPDTFVPDAFVEESCPTTTWRDAYIVWVDAQCAITARCFPKEFVETYCDHASCIVEAMRYHCTSGAEAWCASQYPVDRCDATPTWRSFHAPLTTRHRVATQLSNETLRNHK